MLKHLHSIIEAQPDFECYDNARGMFTEGGRRYSGSGFHRKGHVQIAVRNNACIKGLFFPRTQSAAVQSGEAKVDGIRAFAVPVAVLTVILMSSAGLGSGRSFEMKPSNAFMTALVIVGGFVLLARCGRP